MWVFCLLKLFQYTDPDQFTTFVEPSAGNGSFLHLFPNYCDPDTQLLGFDIEPQADDIIKMDFLTLDQKTTTKYKLDDPDKIIFGTDYPFVSIDKIIQET